MTRADMPVTTGVPGLDAVLGGGLSPHALIMLIGAPGAGKTILASQILFDAARHGVPAIVFTAFSESNEAYLEHLRSLTFFDESLVGTVVQIFALQSLLTSESPSPTSAIARVIRTTGAKIVLLDGFQGIEHLLPEHESFRTLLAALAVHMRYLDVRLLLTLAGDARDPQHHAALTAADVALGLAYTVQGQRHQRLLEVVKQRGRGHLAGLHSYTLGANGVEIFPRVEVYPAPEARAHIDARTSFNLPVLDAILGGGLNVGTTTLIAGAPGVGKTTLALSWALANARPDARSVFVTFSEHPEQLYHKANAFSLNLQDAVARKVVRIIRVPAAELDPDQCASIILTALRAAPVQYLIIDDIAILFHALGERASGYMNALNDILYGANITTLYLLEIPAFDGMRVTLASTPLSVMGDNVIVVQQYELGGVLRRLLAVLRMRLSFFDRTLRELVLDESGVRVLPATESGHIVLATGADLSGGVAPSDVGTTPSADI